MNLLRMRLYQQLFPLSRFVIVVRHPLVVARATAKWSDRNEADLVAHWAQAYRFALADAQRLHARLILRYEDLVADPDAARRALAAFCERPWGSEASETVGDGNRGYVLGATMPLPEGAAAVMGALGYGLDGAVAPLPGTAVAHPLRTVCETVWPPRG